MADDDIFAAFGAPTPCTEPTPARPSITNPSIDVLAGAFTEVNNAIPPNWRGQLNPVYVNQLAKGMLKRGKFYFLCARCHKAIADPRKQYFDQTGGLVYGTDCWATISSKQLSLQMHHSEAGNRTYAKPEELQTYICQTSQKSFEALPENVQHCGPIPRTCGACPGTAVKNKHRPCDFERAIRAK